MNNMQLVIFGIFVIILIVIFIIKSIVKTDNLEKEIDSLPLKYYGTTVDDADNYYNYLIENNFEPIYDYESLEDTNLIWEELQLCQNYLLKTPDDIYALSKRADLYSLLKDYENAINDYKSLIEILPGKIGYVFKCALLYSQINEEENALVLVENAYINQEKDFDYYYTIGCIYKNLQNYDMALDYLTEAIEEYDPESINAYKERAEIYNLLNRTDEYENDLKIIKKLDK